MRRVNEVMIGVKDRVDACQAGWIGIVLSQGTVSAYVAKESVISSKTPAERMFQALASEEIITW